MNRKLNFMFILMTIIIATSAKAGTYGCKSGCSCYINAQELIETCPFSKSICYDGFCEYGENGIDTVTTYKYTQNVSYDEQTNQYNVDKLVEMNAGYNYNKMNDDDVAVETVFEKTLTKKYDEEGRLLYDEMLGDHQSGYVKYYQYDVGNNPDSLEWEDDECRVGICERYAYNGDNLIYKQEANQMDGWLDGEIWKRNYEENYYTESFTSRYVSSYFKIFGKNGEIVYDSSTSDEGEEMRLSHDDCKPYLGERWKENYDDPCNGDENRLVKYGNLLCFGYEEDNECYDLDENGQITGESKGNIADVKLEAYLKSLQKSTESEQAIKHYRIYTIDEANQVAGKTNTFSIRYR